MMKLSRILITLCLLFGLAGVAFVSQEKEPTAHKMADSALKLIVGLNLEQKGKLIYSFDDEERYNWHFVPLQEGSRPTRKGLRLEEMTPVQRADAMELLRASTSDKGYTEATTIMSLESLLKELEKGGSMVRNPGWYFFTIFGSPGKNAHWGWRVEGHHLSLNFTLENGKIISSTPTFFGANPATVKSGERKGTRTLAEAEDLAKDLFRSLDDSQKQTALQSKQYREIEGKTLKPTLGDPQGLSAAKMTEQQRDLLMKLLHSYANRLPADVAESEWEQVKQATPDQIYFGYAGGLEPGQPHSYRIQGPSFDVEFLNVQADSAKNPANHIHSAWRRIKGDFGLTN